MKTLSLVVLGVSVGLLLLYWGIDGIVEVDHAVAVPDGFYLGLYRVVAYPLVIAMNTVSMLGVWRSIVDPWGWFLEGTNVPFFPSLTIFAASRLLWAMRHEELLALDRRIGR